MNIHLRKFSKDYKYSISFGFYTLLFPILLNFWVRWGKYEVKVLIIKHVKFIVNSSSPKIGKDAQVHHT
jgi:hypothetical protein